MNENQRVSNDDAWHSSYKLKPCPEHGAKTIEIESHCTTIPDYRVCCIKCGRGDPRWFQKKEDAIDAWNKRYE